MTRRIRRVLILILAVIFLGSLTMLLLQWREYQAGRDIYTQAEELARPVVSGEEPELPAAPEEVPETPEVPEEPLQDISVTALQEKNANVVGWIQIPGTELSYPLMQGDDNDYYLNHAWNGWETPVGSIFMDYQCSPDLTDFNTIVYGHRMKDASMFSALKGYNKHTYWEEHPVVYIKDGEGLHRYEIFAAYEAPVRSYTYEKKAGDDTTKQAVIDFGLEQSVIDTGVIPEITERILTLSTCTGKGYDSRWVVQAVER